MKYTVNKLAKLSGVSVRTLHFYDEIDLLKPAHYGKNNYRYYEDDQLLMLQQILLYRELTIPLSEIKRIIKSDSFNKVEALLSHKKILQEKLSQAKNLIETIDKTISHLRGNTTMKIEEIFHGFTAEKQALYENFLVDSGVNQEVINEVREKVNDWTKEQWMQHKQEADEIYAALAMAIKNGLLPSSIEVQHLIKKHYQMTTQFWTPNRETYIGLSQFYGSHPDFVKFYDDIHPKLLNFLSAAMKIFAERELS